MKFSDEILVTGIRSVNRSAAGGARFSKPAAAQITRRLSREHLL
jgi:hypothetical protein